MKELSIFVDESGDFGAYNSKYAPQYIFSMVFHEQNNNLEDCIKHYEKEMLKLGFNNHVVHTFPLIIKLTFQFKDNIATPSYFSHIFFRIRNRNRSTH